MLTKKTISMAGAFLLLLAGCRSAAPVTYYTMQSQGAGVLPGAQRPAAQLSIGIGPLALPDYLDRPALVTRASPTRVQIQESHRWAGTLRDEILRALSENLRAMTGARRVEAIPWTAEFSPDVRVRVSIRAFEGEPGGKVNLVADWWIDKPGAGGKPKITSTAIEEPVTENSMESLVAAMSRALADLSRQMAASLLQRF
jgi:uncharacterized lipoprotein YmbA